MAILIDGNRPLVHGQAAVVVVNVGGVLAKSALDVGHVTQVRAELAGHAQTVTYVAFAANEHGLRIMWSVQVNHFRVAAKPAACEQHAVLGFDGELALRALCKHTGDRRQLILAQQSQGLRGQVHLHAFGRRALCLEQTNHICRIDGVNAGHRLAGRSF